MPYCVNCGAVVNETARFCAKCGFQRIPSAISNTVASSHQPSRNVVSNAQGLKSTFPSIDGLLDNLESKYPAPFRSANKHLRDFNRIQLFQFLVYLSAADGQITEDEKDFLNIAFDYKLTAQEYVRLIGDCNINQDAQDIPFAITTATKFDRDARLNGYAIKSSATAILDLYKVAGENFIAIDGVVSPSEKQVLDAFITKVNSYIRMNG